MKFDCPRCQEPIEADDDDVGQSIVCPSCRQPVKVPLPDQIDANGPDHVEQKLQSNPRTQDTDRIPGQEEYEGDPPPDAASVYNEKLTEESGFFPPDKPDPRRRMLATALIVLIVLGVVVSLAVLFANL